MLQTRFLVKFQTSLNTSEPTRTDFLIVAEVYSEDCFRYLDTSLIGVNYYVILSLQS